MAAHRYWQVYCRVNAGNGSFTGVTEIEMATSAGGADVTSTSFAIGSGSYQAGTAADAFDNDFTGDVLQWNGTGAGVWVGQDFGAGNEKDIVEVRIRPNKDAANRTFGEFDIRYSDDGTNWTSLFACTHSAWVVGTTATFTLPTAVPHRYWRVRGASNYLGNAVLAGSELQMRTAINGSTVLSGGTISARSAFAGTSAANLLDGNPATIYSSNSSIANSEWIQYDFGSGNDKAIVEVAWRPRDDTSWQQATRTGWVESSPDSLSWLVRWPYGPLATARTYTAIITDPASVAATSTPRYWGLRPNTVQSGSIFTCRELEMRPTLGGTDQCTGGTGISLAAFDQSLDANDAFDNGTDQYSSANLTDILVYDFGAGSGISLPAQLAFTSGGGAANAAPTDFDLVYSNYNGGWTLAQNFTSPATWTNNETRLFNPTIATGRRRQIVNC